MNGKLTKLSNALRHFGLTKEADDVDQLTDWDESWHEEATKEFEIEDVAPEPPIPMDEYTGFSKIFSKHNIIPVSSGGGARAKIGEGSFGSVYRVIYDGKPAAAKLIMTHERGAGSMDIGNWKKIIEAKDKMDIAIQKYIPQVYALIEEDDYHIIIMEELKPIPPSLYKYMDANSFIYRNTFDDEEYLWEIVNSFIGEMVNTQLNMMMYSDNANLRMLSDAIKKSLSEQNTKTDMMKHWMENSSKFPPKGTNYIPLILNWMLALPSVVDVYHSIDFEERMPVYDMLKLLISQGIGSLFKFLPVPTSYKKIQLSNFPPETKGLMEMLTQLEKHGIKWQDVHRDNVMIGSDGNLKIIDVGLYN